MKKTAAVILAGLTCILLTAMDQITIYNDGFALVRSQIDLNLDKGLQSYMMENIPSTIEANSVIIKPLKGDIKIFSQNYEYDLANTSKILEKYIQKEIDILSKEGQKYSGILQFNDSKTIGLKEKTTNKLILMNKDEIIDIKLAELPENFFLKPTLHWRLISEKSGNYPIDFSYICSRLRWEVTYNAVWNAENKELGINSWVTISNHSGKGFSDTKLKLIAGDVQKIREYRRTADVSMKGGEYRELTSAVPSFEEKAFHDFHLYTLDKKVTINNLQTKQIRLFPTVLAEAKSLYEYKTYSSDIISKIEFENSEKFGLGMPLPKGIFKIYKLDTADNNLEFIGEDRIDHTARDEKVKLTSGKAFDVKAETKVLEQRKISRQINEKDILVEIRNRSGKDKKIIIIHRLNGYWEIFKESVKYQKKSANKINFEINVKAGETAKITWTERIEH